MADTTVRYRRADYRRVCDVCGMLRNISDMHKQDELWVCTYDAGERVRTELDRGNARQRPFTIKPVPYPKPQDHFYPNTLETDDAAVFNFLAQQVAAQCRYEQIESGAAPMQSLGGELPALSWAARYFYDLIQENDQSRRLLIPRAKVLLATIADFLTTRQQGFGLSPTSTRANDAFYGGFLASGASTWVTEDAATSGLALLYAYRVLGTLSYRDGARAAASYLRNVQAIGSNGTHYTSTSASGAGRLYTGSLASEVSTASGFYSNSLFYPSALLALEFWNELKLTDGDQSVGSTGTPTGFDSAPAQLLSASITDLRDCWSTGITDSTGTLINGLSSTTPREVFNAYPVAKTNFPAVFGSGMWEYADGDSEDGTQVSSQNYGMALSALYNYEGATSQVTTISDWLRSFSSNPDFETPDNTSTSDLYHSTTGTYDPTLTIATRLTVRDASGNAVAMNGTSVYDWGAFGLLSRIWASRNRGSFMQSRLYPLNTVQRYYDGNYTDGLNMDRVALRGVSGLTMQTGFYMALTSGIGDTGGSFSTPPTSGGTGLPGTGLIQAFWGNLELTVAGGRVSAWGDQSGTNQDLTQPNPTNYPYYTGADIDGIPSISFGTGADANKALITAGNLKDRNGVDLTSTGARTVMAVIRPRFDAAWGVTGGQVWSMPDWQALFDLETAFTAGGAWAWARAWRNDATAMTFGSGFGGASGPYEAMPLLCMWRSEGGTNLTFALNTHDLALTPGTMPGSPGPPGQAYISATGTISFLGDIAAVAAWDWAIDPSARQQAEAAFGSVFGSLGLTVATFGITNDAVRAAQFGRSFREVRS